jgi:N-acetylneuraminic acid mutarotase
MQKLIAKLIIITVFALSALFRADLSLASEPFGSWTSTTSLPIQTSSQISQIYNDRLFVLTGGNSNDLGTNISSIINSNGSLQEWVSSEVQSPLIIWATSIIKDNHIILFGGANHYPANSINNVVLGNIDESNSIKSWTQLNPLPKNLHLGSAVIYQNRIYFAGGATENNGGGMSSVNDQVYTTTINQDGTINEWVIAGTMPKALFGFGLITSGNNLLVIGGQDYIGNDQSTVYKASISTNGTVGNWQTINNLPQPIYRSGIIKIGSQVVSIGGLSNGNYVDKVYFAALQSDGSIGNWETSVNNFPYTYCCGAVAASSDYIYYTAGHDGNYWDTVYYAKINSSTTPTPSPTPTPTVVPSPTATPSPSPTPSPTPITSLNVPLLKQTSEPWQSHLYDSANVWSPSRKTIGDWGCAMTSAAMVFQYNGIKKLPDGTILDPDSLNTWLKNQPDGYMGTGWVNWLALARLSKQAKAINNITAFDALEYSRIIGSNRTQLTNDIHNGIADILEESGHYVVGTGISADTFTINDPYYTRNTIKEGYGNTFLSLGRYTPSHTDLSYIMITTDPNVSLTIKDSEGNSVGESFTQAAISDPKAPSKKNSPIKIYYLPKPATGAYNLAASGNGNFQFSTYLYDASGSAKTQNFNGNGQVNYAILFNKSDKSNSRIDKLKTITFDSTIQDIKDAKKAHKIDNVLADALIILMQTAKSQANKHPQTAKQLVQSAITIIDSSKKYSWLISQDTYQKLSEDFKGLKNSL